MLLQNDVKDYAIIGEAALRLALVRKEITISSLLAMLDHMAGSVDSDIRLTELTNARTWLMSFMSEDCVSANVPYLRALMDLNERKS